MTDRRKPMSAEEVKYARAYLEEWGCLAEPLVVRLLDQAADEVEASAAPLLGAMPPSDRRVLEICDNMASKLDAICRTEANDNTTCLARLATNNLDELRAVLADRATRSAPLAVGGVPPTHVVVPREPTPEMIEAGAEAPGMKNLSNMAVLTQIRDSGRSAKTLDWGDGSPLEQAWRAMIAVATAAEKEGKS